MKEPRPDRKKPLIGNAYVVGHLMEIQARMQAAGDEQSLHIAEAIQIVLDAGRGGKI